MPRQPTKAQLAEALDDSGKMMLTLQERITELEMVIEDRDFEWAQISGEGSMEFARDQLAGIVRTARLMYLKNPLIQRAVRVQAHYVFGQGFSFKAETPEVDELIQKFAEDPANNRVLTNQQAALMAEEELSVTGNLFIVLFTDPSSGRVVLRLIPVEEITDIICNPEDSQEVWYYRRQHNVGRGLGDASEPQTTYYPDWQYTPDTRPASINGHSIQWNSPVYHVKVGGFFKMKFGVPEVYAALDWARSVTRDLEDYASVRRSLSRWAWRVTTGGGPRGVAALKSRFNTTLADGSAQGETNPPPTAASMFISGPNTQLEPVRTAGAAPHPDEGRRLWLMVSAGTGIPETILAGDADVGNLATARTLDRPTELQMSDRVQLWKMIFEDILSYVIQKGIEAPRGFIRRLGRVIRDDYSGEPMIILNGDMSSHVDVEFPSILERDPIARVTAIVQAVQSSTLPVMTHETLVRLLLTALGVDDIAGEWEALQDELAAAEERRQAMADIFGQTSDSDGDEKDDEEEGDEDQEEREARIIAALRHVDLIMRNYSKTVGENGNGHAI